MFTRILFLITVAALGWLSYGALEPRGRAAVGGVARAAAQASDFVWVEDSVPAGAIQEGTGEGWNWTGASSFPAPFSGTATHQSNFLQGLHQHYFYNATQTMTVGPDDVLVAYVFLHPMDSPTQVMLQWHDAGGNWEHRAYWAASASSSGIPWGVEGTGSRRYMGPPPPPGQWVRLEVPAAQVGLAGRTLHGMAFTLFDGQASWDRAGKYTPVAPTPTPTPTPTPGPTPILPHADCEAENVPTGPCHLLSDLHWAMNNISGPPPHPNWENRLDWSYQKWAEGGSENWAPIAHAIALWKPAPYGGGLATRAQKVSWWNTFLTCQMGGAWNGKGCPVASDNQVKYLKGTELLSNLYDHGVVSAVAAVHYWATRVVPNQTLANNARAYLRASFAMYTLAAGREWAVYKTQYYDAGQSETKDDCHTNDSGGLYYRGPLIAAAGMRSTPAGICQDNRGHLLVRALQLSLTARREQIEQAAVLKYLQDNWRGNSFDENVYALSADDRSALNGHRNNTLNAADFLKGLLGEARTSAGYNFLGWSDPAEGQVRATLMERNLNHNTVAIYGIKYLLNSHEVHVLFPWHPLIWRSEVSKGKGELRPLGSTTPSAAWATNFNPLDPHESDFRLSTPEKDPGVKHGVRQVSMPLPTAGKQYHVRLRPDGPPQCLPGPACQ